jgi:glycosyltransferase involved in cell wall biosynthesis
LSKVSKSVSVGNGHSESGDNPRISVITAFLDGEAFLAEAIESVIQQTFCNWELLLIDDGSGEAATTIARAYAARYPKKIRDRASLHTLEFAHSHRSRFRTGNCVAVCRRAPAVGR